MLKIKLLTSMVVACVTLGTTAENWPGFRGPTRQGESKESGVPTKWSDTENIAWKAVIPGEAWSSPIVWKDDVFVTTTTDAGTKCHVICFDRKDGQILWARQVFEQVPLKKEGRNSYATPTPVTDGATVFAVFGDGSIVALSTTGEVRWENREVKFYGQHGLGASPILHGDLLIMPFDGSAREGEKRIGWQIPWDKSFILALDKKTGKEKWRGQRGMSRISHVTPNIYSSGGKEYLASGAGDVVQGFDLATGKRLWSVASKGEGVVPSIVIGEGLIYSASGFEAPTIRAVRPGTETQEAMIAWEQKKGVPSVSSMAYSKPHIFAITDGGVASCMKADTGEIVWSERVGGNHSASPIVAEGRIFFLAEDGLATIINAGPEFKILQQNKLNDGKFQASMAVSQKQLFIRGEHRLYCIGAR